MFNLLGGGGGGLLGGLFGIGTNILGGVLGGIGDALSPRQPQIVQPSPQPQPQPQPQSQSQFPSWLPYAGLAGGFLVFLLLIKKK